MITRDNRNKTAEKREAGSIITLFALSVVVIFFTLGLSIDLGSAYVAQARLSKSVDAGVLAGARNTARGDVKIQDIALKIARANMVIDQPVSYSVQISSPVIDTKRVTMRATTNSRTTFAVLMGKTSLDVSAEGEATRYPLDMSLTLDLSYSLQRNNAFDDMQRAATGFLNYFDDSVDQVGIATYSTWAEDKLPLQKYFQIPGTTIISGLSAISDTDIQEGLRVSKAQLDGAFKRTGALKIVVLFTDGRPTAYRDTFNFSDPACATYDGVAATYISGSSFRGMFKWQDGRKIVKFIPTCTTTTQGNLSGTASPVPTQVSTAGSAGNFVRAQGIIKAEAQADLIRAAGYTIYAIGLGNPNATNAGDVPDLAFLGRVTNEGGHVNAAQPRGEVIFAPSPAQLDDAFAKLADRLLTRLTR